MSKSVPNIFTLEEHICFIAQYESLNKICFKLLSLKDSYEL